MTIIGSGAAGGQDEQRVPKPGEYLRAARAELRNDQQKAAYKVMLQAVQHYPDDPLIISYYGCLLAIVDKKYRSGVESCRRAITLFKPLDSYTAGTVYPVLYLNLGRAYLASGRKKEAVQAFQKGQSYDRGHGELKKELGLLGARKRPVVPFLSRSNPINKFIGLLLHKAGKGDKKKAPGKG